MSVDQALGEIAKAGLRVYDLCQLPTLTDWKASLILRPGDATVSGYGTRPDLALLRALENWYVPLSEPMIELRSTPAKTSPSPEISYEELFK